MNRESNRTSEKKTIRMSTEFEEQYLRPVSDNQFNGNDTQCIKRGLIVLKRQHEHGEVRKKIQFLEETVQQIHQDFGGLSQEVAQINEKVDAIAQLDSTDVVKKNPEVENGEDWGMAGKVLDVVSNDKAKWVPEIAAEIEVRPDEAWRGVITLEDNGKLVRVEQENQPPKFKIPS